VIILKEIFLIRVYSLSHLTIYIPKIEIVNRWNV